MNTRTNTRNIIPARLKKIALWGVVIGTAAWVIFFYSLILLSIVYPSIVPNSWFIELLKSHPAGTIGVAMAAVSAFTIVVVLGFFKSNDPIEIKFIGVELKGSAGPIVLWVLCFFTIVSAGKLLW